MALSRRETAWVGALSGSLLALAAAATVAEGSDLVLTRVSPTVASSDAGAVLSIRERARNRGRSNAIASVSRYYLSRDGERSASDTGLVGRRKVPPLRPGRASAGTASVTVPGIAATGSFRVIGCADARDDVRERRERNNCLASDSGLRVSKPTCCRRGLQRLRVPYSLGPTRTGVADPVTVGLPLGGVAYFGAGETSPQRQLFMDCNLARALVEMGRGLTSVGITAVEHFGVYEYRCIAGTDPCVLSQHATATAIDLHEFRSGAGETFNVEDDWVIDPDSETTCAAPTLSPKDAFLHMLVCEWDATNLFHIILTPNYNADHRNHFHLDLTPAADFIE